MSREFTHDAYSPLDYKTVAFGTGTRPGVKSWIPEEHARRIAAYRLLAAVADNIGRHFLPAGLTADQVAKYREYGHADRVITGARAALLGDEQSIHVPGAEAVAVPDGQKQPAEVVAAQAAKDYLDQWALNERLWLEMAEAEADCAKLGDSVWMLYWDADKGRPRVVTYDPGFYFPVRDPGPKNDFARRLHFAWEEKSANGLRQELHQLTFSLDLIRPARDPFEPVGTLNYLHNDDGTPVLQPGDRLSSDGMILRDYPWNDKPSTITCHFTDAIYDLSKVKGNLYALDPQDARYGARELDLGLDFIPVVHVPNTPARREGFGRSTLMMVAQVLDDLSATDTDLSESGALVGNATLVTKGGPAGGLEGGPGMHLDLPTEGSAEYLDVSKNLDALLKLKGALAKDLSVNSRLSDAVLGRTDATTAVSGLALALSFSPTSELVREGRAVRNEKYPLLLKMVLRMAQANGDLDPGATPAAEVLFGSFLPADRQEAVKLITEAIKAGVMSLETGVLYLQEQGFPIDDAVEEVRRILSRDFAAAVQLVEATGNVADAYAFLGLTPATDAGGSAGT